MNSRPLRNPAVTGRLFGMKAAITAKEILGATVNRTARDQMWARSNVHASLQMVADLLARVDLAVIDDTRDQVELSWTQALSPVLRNKLEPLVSVSYRGLISPRALIQCAREIIESATDDDTARAVDADELTWCLLGINGEHDYVSGELGLLEMDRFDAESIAGITSVLDGLDDNRLRELMRAFSVDEIAELAFEKPETIETLLPLTHDMWRRPWPPTARVDRLIGSSPASVYEDVFGIPFDDILAFGRLLVDRAAAGQTRFTADELRRWGVTDATLQHVDRHMVTSLPDLREAFRSQQEAGLLTAWSRFEVQRFPFIRLPDGALLLLRTQMGVQRIFGDLPYFDVRQQLHDTNPRARTQFEQAMNAVFEARISEIFRRIGAQPHLRGTHFTTESAMQQQWTEPGSSGPPSVCDFVVVRGRYCLVADANNRRLTAQLSEGQGSPEILDRDVERNLLGHKFPQLASTIEHLVVNGLPGDSSAITEDTIFVPLVVTPDSGLPYSEFVDFQITEKAHPIFAGLAHYVAPPALITITDLAVLEGIADHAAADPMAILGDWRARVARGMPLRLSSYLDVFVTPYRPMPRRTLGRFNRMNAELRGRLRPAALSHST